MSESSVILPSILIALQKRWPDSVWARRNTGVARSGARMVRFGLPGMADIFGILCGRAVEIEVKRPGQKLRAAQVRWKAAVERAGGLHITAESAEQAVYETEKFLEELHVRGGR